MRRGCEEVAVALSNLLEMEEAEREEESCLTHLTAWSQLTNNKQLTLHYNWQQDITMHKVKIYSSLMLLLKDHFVRY